MKSLRQQKQKRFAKNQKKWLIAGGVAAAVLLIAGGAWLTWKLRTDATVKHQADATAAAEQAPVKTSTPPVNVSNGKPSQDGQPTNTAPAANTPSTTTPTQKAVSPVISYAGYADNTNQQVEVDAFVPEILEDGGTCTMTATKGTQKVTAQTAGHKNVSQTRCDNFLVNRSQFPSGGSWNIVVTYESATAKGSVSKDVGL